MKTSSQRIRIAAHLLGGESITQRGAIDLFGCWRLSDVIYKLKRGIGAPNGHTMPIVTEMVDNGNGGKHAEYRIERRPA